MIWEQVESKKTAQKSNMNKASEAGGCSIQDDVASFVYNIRKGKKRKEMETVLYLELRMSRKI